MRYGDRQPLKPGYYWELSTGNIVRVPSLQMGDRRKRYLRVPALLVLLLGPLLGLLYVIWMPLAGFAVLVALLLRRLARSIRAVGKAVSVVVAAGRQHDKEA